MSQNFLITGATGHQGGAVITALSALENNSFTIYALTRNINSARAQKLVTKYKNLKLVSGSFDDPTAIFSACNMPISCVFAVQMPSGFPPGAGTEEKHGKNLIDAAIAHDVKVYVQTTVDRGPHSDTNPTDIPHFRAKHNIEKHLKLRAEESGGAMSFTILRPTSFMDNFASGFIAKVAATSWRDVLPPTRKVQLIAVKDIGWFAAQALTNPDDGTYKNKSLSLAGDDLSYEEMDTVYRESTGHSIPTTFGAVRWALFQIIKELPMTLDFFRDPGFSADIEELRRLNPALTTFRMWVDQNKKLGP